jgi:MerR family copper efflux transcriptional regulator
MERRLTVGRLAEAAGVKASTVRYYEQLGLLPQATRTTTGYRMFPHHAVRRITLVRAAQRLGFALHEIAGFLRVRDSGGTPCQHVRDAGQQLLNTLDAEIAGLRARRRQISRTLHVWDQILSTTPADQPAHLLERLRVRPSSPTRPVIRRTRHPY